MVKKVSFQAFHRLFYTRQKSKLHKNRIKISTLDKPKRNKCANDYKRDSS